MILSFQKCCVHGIIQYATFWGWLVSLSIINPDYSSFSLLSSTACTMACLTTQSLKAIVNKASFVYRTSVYRFPYGLSFLWNKCWGVQLLGHVACLVFSVFKKLPSCFAECLQHWTVLPAMCLWPSFSASTPAFGIFTTFNFSHSDRYGLWFGYEVFPKEAHVLMAWSPADRYNHWKVTGSWGLWPIHGLICWWVHKLMELLGGDRNFWRWGLVEGGASLGLVTGGSAPGRSLILS
jgi:hypothetical protein